MVGDPAQLLRCPMFLNNVTLMIMFVLGVIVALIGMGFRDKNPGMILMGIGFLTALFAVVKKVMEVFGW